MAMSLVASTRGLALMPAYAENYRLSQLSAARSKARHPIIEVVVGYSKLNTSPILKLFLSRLPALTGPNQKH